MKYFLSVCLIAASLSFASQESIPLRMDAIERGEISEKYTISQRKEIGEALSSLDEKVRVVSFNVLFDRYDHKLEEKHRWPNRKVRVIQAIHEMGADILATQELTENQLCDILPELSDDYSHFAGSFSTGTNAVFYNHNRFLLLDAKDEGVCARLILQDKVNGQVFALLNTHLAFSDMEKREFQARAIHKLMRKCDIPVILTGDMNVFSNRPDKGFPFLDGDYVLRLLKGEIFSDAKDICLLGHLGPISTFTNANDEDITAFAGTGTPGVIFDRIIVSKDVKVLMHAVNPVKVNGEFPSDHMPIIADLLIR